MGKAIILIALLVVLMIAVSVLIVLILLDGDRSKGGNAYGSGGIDVQTGRESGEVLHGFHGVNDETVPSGGRRYQSGAAAFLEDCANRKQYRVGLNPGSVIGRTVRGYPSINDVSVSYSVQVSRRHCVMYLECGRVMLRSISKSTYTAVNDRIIEVPCEIRQGDLIRLGDTQLRVILIQL